MRKRREIAGGADRTLAGHDGMDARIHQLQQPLDHDRAHAGESARKARGLEHEGETYRGIRERHADARRMRAHEIELQCRKLAVGDARLRELAEAGVDSVQRFARLQSRANRSERLLDRLAPALRKQNRIRAA